MTAGEVVWAVALVVVAWVLVTVVSDGVTPGMVEPEREPANVCRCGERGELP